jgi:hypothetical protein
MMIGPEPITSTEFRSARLGIAAVHQLAELAEQTARVVRAGRGLRVVLHAENRKFLVSHSFDGVVVQVDVTDLDILRE